MFGNTEIDDDNIASDDEDWGPQRRRRRTIPDDPSRPRPSQVRRRRARSALPSGSQGEGAADTPGEREKRMWRRLPDSAVEVCYNLNRMVVRSVCMFQEFIDGNVIKSWGLAPKVDTIIEGHDSALSFVADAILH
jgi:hypothetical protein